MTNAATTHHRPSRSMRALSSWIEQRRPARAQPNGDPTGVPWTVQFFEQLAQIAADGILRK